jgi:hypothetical protein
MYYKGVNHDSEIFTKVSDPERQRLFKDLATNRTQIVCKGESDQIYHFVADRTTPKNELLCTIPFGIPAPLKDNDLVCNFFIGGERYFFRTLATVEKDLVHLKTDTELFHLQRRQNYRIKIPENYLSKFSISAANGFPVKVSGTLYDLSSGGCRVTVNAALPVLGTGQEITGQVVIGNREPIDFEGTIRHYKMEGSTPQTTKQIFGVEFKPLSTFLEGKLFAVTLDLHREFFSRLNTKL